MTKPYLKTCLVVLMMIFTQTSIQSKTKHSVKLTWDASITPGVNYHVWRSNNSTIPKKPLLSTSNLEWKDISVLSGKSYWYWVSAYDSTGESSLDGPVGPLTI